MTRRRKPMSSSHGHRLAPGWETRRTGISALLLADSAKRVLLVGVLLIGLAAVAVASLFAPKSGGGTAEGSAPNLSPQALPSAAPSSAPVSASVPSASASSSSPGPVSSPAAPTRTPRPTATPLPVAFGTLTTPVFAGQYATASVTTAPGAVCEIKLGYPAPSGDPALAPAAATSKGQVFWSWMVPVNTPSGDWSVAVSCSRPSAHGTATKQLHVL